MRVIFRGIFVWLIILSFIFSAVNIYMLRKELKQTNYQLYRITQKLEERNRIAHSEFLDLLKDQEY